jgi:hypothetical protein
MSILFPDFGFSTAAWLEEAVARARNRVICGGYGPVWTTHMKIR